MSFFDGLKSGLFFRQLFSIPNVLPIILCAIIAYVVFSSHITSNATSQMKSQIAETQSTMSALQDNFRQGDFSRIGDVQSVQKELDNVKQTMQEQMEQFRLAMEKGDEARSRRAVERAKLAVLKGRVSVVKQKLTKLKSELASWTARQGSLMSGDPGRRIVGSETHLRLLRGILAQERPTETEVTEWQLIIDQLAPLIEAGSHDPDALIIITPEHKEMISNAETWLNKNLAEFEQQNLLISAILKETGTMPPAKSTLGDLLKSEEERKNRELTAQLDGVLERVEEESKADRIRRVEQRRREVREAETRALEAEEQAKIATAELKKKLNEEKAAEEMKIAQAEARAHITRSRETVADIDAAAARQKLEAEFKRDKGIIEQHLAAFTGEGYTLRHDKSKGPASLSVLVAEGALKPGRPGLEMIMRLAHRENERPKGAIPFFLGSEFSWNQIDKKPVETAQELLKKYGKLMVDKGILAE